jgi:hypothetical protein
MANANDPHHFDFDLDRGIRRQVVEKLEPSPLLSLQKLLVRVWRGGLRGLEVSAHRGAIARLVCARNGRKHVYW